MSDAVQEYNALLEGQPQLLDETLLDRFALLDRTVEIEDLLRGLSGEGGEAPATAADRSSGCTS